MAEDTILVAHSGFTCEHDGASFTVKKGSTFRVGHPLVEGREELFEPFVVDFEHEAPARHRAPAKKAAGS